jgi:hypothetical protein
MPSKPTNLAFIASGILGTLSLATAFLWVRMGAWGLVALVVGAFWLFSGPRGARWRANVIAPLFLLSAGFSYSQLGAPLVVALLAVLGTMGAWDLDLFMFRLNHYEHIANQEVLIKGHLQRVLIAGGLGLGVAGAAMVSQVRLTFGTGLILGLLAFWGLNQVLRQVRR